MPHDELKQKVLDANLALVEAGLVVLTWGNASAADRNAGIIAIKPSGVPYDRLTANDMIVLDIASGKVVDGPGRPSSDTPTHLHLYRCFPAIGSVVHTHSTYATSFAQSHRPIPCLGTTHADNFYGEIPVTREMTTAEIESDYELNTGRVIEECFTSNRIDPTQIPGVLLASHAPFAWGPTPEKAVENAIVLEFTARMAMNSLTLNAACRQIPKPLLDKHFLRKHGPKAYYGQTN